MRVLIVKLSSIGDIVHTLPAAALLRRALPDARIAWVAERRASAILRGSPVADELIELDTRSWRSAPLLETTRAEARAAVNQIRGGDHNTDVAIDFQGLLKSGLVARMSRAPVRVGFGTSELREKASRVFLTSQIDTSACEHVIEKNLRLARAVIAEHAPESSAQHACDYEFPIEIPTEDELYIEGETRIAGAGFAILNPGGGWPTKLWPAERYGRLADLLWIEYGLASFVTYGPGEEILARTVVEASHEGSARLLDASLKQFVALARRARLFVGGDSGPLHLAAAAGTPIVGIYGPTSPLRNGPFNRHDLTVGRNLWCRDDCYRRSCWHWECMDIPVSRVIAAAAARLAADRKVFA